MYGVSHARVNSIYLCGETVIRRVGSSSVALRTSCELSCGKYAGRRELFIFEVGNSRCNFRWLTEDGEKLGKFVFGERGREALWIEREQFRTGGQAAQLAHSSAETLSRFVCWAFTWPGRSEPLLSTSPSAIDGPRQDNKTPG